MWVAEVEMVVASGEELDMAADMRIGGFHKEGGVTG